MSGKFIEVEEIKAISSGGTILVAKKHIVGLRILPDLTGVLMLAHGMPAVHISEEMARDIWEDLLDAPELWALRDTPEWE